MRCAVVTGSRGFIGRRLIARLRHQGWDVLGIGSTPGPAEGLLGSQFHCWNGTEILPKGWSEGPFTLVDLAWTTNRPSTYLPHAAHLVRLATLLDALLERGLKAVVGVGSAEEYGQRDGLLNEENPPEGRLSSYGWGKRAAGAMLRSWSATTGIPTYWLRPFLVYGPGQQGNMVVPYAVRQALKGEAAELSDGLQRRDFVYVDDVADALVAAVESPAESFEIVNVGTGMATAVREVLTEIAERLGAPHCFRFGEIPRRAGEPALQVADTEKARRLLGWQAQIGWQEGVRRLMVNH